jgi:2-keto-4-pentenoate hydratase/2-oxohepta-3-ene-1,7-dioic acid hydratase in catechol pathway
MKLCRFGNDRLGVVGEDGIRDVTDALDVLPACRHPLPGHDVLIANLDRLRARIESLVERAPVLALEGQRLLSPVANPGKIVCALSNYRSTGRSGPSDPGAGAPAKPASPYDKGLALKAASSVVGAGEGIVLRRPERQSDHEVELAVVIGRRASDVGASEALQHVAGYAIGLDITMRGAEERSFRKSPDTYTVLGPWLVTADEVLDPGALEIGLSVNGVGRQTGSTSSMVLDVAGLVAYASSFFTLHPGDILLTGTPEGAGGLSAGDRIVASIEGIGSMQVNVRANGSGAHPG